MYVVDNDRRLAKHELLSSNHILSVLLSQLYQFEVCPFRNVTQREYRPKEWEAIEAAQKSDSHHIPLRDTRPVSVPSSKVGQGVVTHVVQQCVVTQVVPQHRNRMCAVETWSVLPGAVMFDVVTTASDTVLAAPTYTQAYHWSRKSPHVQHNVYHEVLCCREPFPQA